MVGRVFIAILALLIFLGFTPVISKGIHNMRTEEIVRTETVVTAAETEADFVLDPELFQDKLSEVISVSSSIFPEETPQYTYAPDTNTLTVSELLPDRERVLTIRYYAELADEYMGIIGPFLTFIIFGGVIFALIWGVWRRA